MTGAEPRIPRAFAGAEIGDRQNRAYPDGFVRLVSNADFPISGIAGRERASPVCSCLRLARIQAVAGCRTPTRSR